MRKKSHACFLIKKENLIFLKVLVFFSLKNDGRLLGPRGGSAADTFR